MAVLSVADGGDTWPVDVTVGRGSLGGGTMAVTSRGREVTRLSSLGDLVRGSAHA